MKQVAVRNLRGFGAYIGDPVPEDIDLKMDVRQKEKTGIVRLGRGQGIA